MAQGADGWLWLGTSTGLYRFDGVRFAKFVPAPGEMLLGRAISAVVAKPNGDLWIGYIFGTGISRLRNGHLQHYLAQPSIPIGATFGIEADLDGVLWAATIDGLMRFEHGLWQRVGAAWNFPGSSSRAVFRDQYRQLWAANETQLFKLDQASKRFLPVGPAGDTDTLAQSPDGHLWQTVGDTMRRVPDGPHARRLPRAPGAARQNGHSGIFDREGNLWSKLTPAGLRWTSAAELGALGAVTPDTPAGAHFDQLWQMSSLDLRTMLEDGEGNIWISTADSLERFRHSKLATVAFPPGANYFSMARDAGGDLYAASSTDRRLWRLASADGALQLTPASSSTGWSAVARGADGSLLLADQKGVERRLAGRTERFPYPPVPQATRNDNRITSIVDDGNNLWVSLRNRSVYRLVAGTWAAARDYGLPEPVLYMAADRQGHMWFGYKDNRVIEYDRGMLRTYGAAEGLDLGTVTFLDATCELLAVGSNGMAVLRGGRFRRLTSDDPDLLSNVSGALVTSDGDRWLNASRGVVHIEAAHWQAAMAQPERALHYQLLDALHGYPGVNQTSVRSAAAVHGEHGQLWFIASAGLAMLDPARLSRNPVPPPVQILGLRSGERQYRPDETIRLAAGSNSLNIAYTALSFNAPEQVRFRYRLEGVDRDWQEVGTRRTAYYANLPPGSYRFRVLAANEDGVWSPQGAALAFELAPGFYQTGWFIAVCIVLVTSFLYLLYLTRVAQLTRRLRETLLVRQMERERIARGMHDTLLQSMQGLILRVQGVADRLVGHDTERNLMADILDQADAAMHEGRMQVMDLRIASQLSIGLEQALAAVATSAAIETRSGATFAVDSKGAPHMLEAGVGEEIFNLGREALLNAYRHAGAGRIAVRLVYGSKRFDLHIEDDGCGIDPALLQRGRYGHFGLAGMRERSARIGARLDIRSQTGGGTTVALGVPGRLAYLPADRAGLWCWLPRWRHPRFALSRR
jgi:signal transduction histidine kinase/ligand-binding sensor domain-containing protein